MFFHHTPGQLPPHDTGDGVKTVTLGWVGAPNERTQFRIQDAVVGFVNRCLSRIRNLAASNQNIGLSFFLADVGSTSAPDLFFPGFSKSSELLFFLNVLIGSVVLNIVEGILEIQTFSKQFAFPFA